MRARPSPALCPLPEWEGDIPGRSVCDWEVTPLPLQSPPLALFGKALATLNQTDVPMSGAGLEQGS